MEADRAKQYCDQLEAHMDAGGSVAANNVRDLIQFVRAAESELSRMRGELVRIRDGEFDWAAGSMRQIAREALSTLNPEERKQEEKQ